MGAVERQIELKLARRVNAAFVPVETVRAQKTAGAAFTLACITSGLEDKEIIGAFSEPMDAGTFSRMKSGKNTLQADHIAEFCDIVCNTIYPEWIASRVGCGLVMLKSEAERQRDEAERALAEEKMKVVMLTDLLRGPK